MKTFQLVVLAIVICVASSQFNELKFLSEPTQAKKLMLTPVDVESFLTNIIDGASDVEASKNACATHVTEFTADVSTDITELYAALKNKQVVKIVEALMKLGKTLASLKGGYEEVCHFKALGGDFERLTSYTEWAKLTWRVAKNASSFYKASTGIISAYESGDYAALGLDVGTLLKITVDYHTQ